MFGGDFTFYKPHAGHSLDCDKLYLFSSMKIYGTDDLIRNISNTAEELETRSPDSLILSLRKYVLDLLQCLASHKGPSRNGKGLTSSLFGKTQGYL